MTAAAPPLTVIGGYLGAGKTTLLNHLLTQAHGLRCAVLVNDFGEVNIDAALIVSHDGDTISLENGCLCCSMADGFAVALGRILQTPDRLDHIVVEASGVAEPRRIAQTAQAFRVPVDGVLVVVDAEQVRTQADNKYVGDTVRRQLAQADMLIVNKVDLVDPGALDDLHRWLADHAPAVPTYDTIGSRLPPEILFGHVQHRPTVQDDGERQFGHGHRSRLLERDQPVSRQALTRYADRLGRRAFRAKGFVRLDEDAERTYLFQLVGKRWSLTEAVPSTARETGVRIVIVEPRDMSPEAGFRRSKRGRGRFLAVPGIAS
jgi:G3E family GTPase